MSKEIEDILRWEAIEKKKTGNGARHRASRTGRGKGYMPSDLLKGKELEEYKGNSPVTVYHIDKDGRRID